MYPQIKTTLQEKGIWSSATRNESGHDENGNNQQRRMGDMMGLTGCRSALKTSSGGSVNSSSQTSSSSSSDSSVILSKFPFGKKCLLPASATISSSDSSSSSSYNVQQHVEQCAPVVIVKDLAVKKPSSCTKMVVALHDFTPLNPETDLPLSKSQEYEVLNEQIDGCSGWWIVKNKMGETGFIPANYVKEKSSSSSNKGRNSSSTCNSSSSSPFNSSAPGVYSNYHQPQWFLPELDRRSSERILKADGRIGAFCVRYSTSQCLFTISVLVKKQHPSQPEEVKHYLVRQTIDGSSFYLSEHQRFSSLESLIHFHRQQCGSLAVRLKYIPSLTSANHGGKQSVLSQIYRDKSWEIRACDLALQEELGSGQFGVVRRGKWTKVVTTDAKAGNQKQVSLEVAVKLMKEGTMSEADFVREAKVMTKLRHPNLVQLYGLCIEHRPICIVTEFMKHGSLLSFLRSHGSQLKQNSHQLVEMCIQVCDGMAYLEAKNYIHRDLAARNCLVGTGNKVKVADFGLARFVADSNEYTSSTCTKFPIRWAPPEVLWYSKFSSKSDVWAFGVLLWEIFTCGQMPYGKSTNAQVVEMVRMGKRLERPRLCSREIFRLMQDCWQELAEDRPFFAQLYTRLKNLPSEQ